MGRAIVQDLRRTGFRQVILQPVRIDKEARFLAQSARFESGQVHVPRDAPWYAEWLKELLGFPNARHDDQVDSTSQALAYLTRRTKPQNPSRREKAPGRDRPRPEGQRFRSRRS